MDNSATNEFAPKIYLGLVLHHFSIFDDVQDWHYESVMIG
jgi:hypothetical protein